jgi:hypothetical protein
MTYNTILWSASAPASLLALDSASIFINRSPDPPLEGDSSSVESEFSMLALLVLFAGRPLDSYHSLDNIPLPPGFYCLKPSREILVEIDDEWLPRGLAPQWMPAPDAPLYVAISP